MGPEAENELKQYHNMLKAFEFLVQESFHVARDPWVRFPVKWLFLPSDSYWTGGNKNSEDWIFIYI